MNMMKKKVGDGKLETIIAEYSTNSFVGVNSKLKDLVDKSYDMNRSAFYAYGAYINNFRANLLKFIFKTEAINVAALSKSFGFATPPRVRDGKFLKVEARKERLR
jgi:ATP-dependent RNA helicase DDX18/HAS1